jgi:UDP-N-acetylmuramyl pentapeptide phosphotransferase/UDP-N-acetylglucosamine-1-phosphate transferase
MMQTLQLISAFFLGLGLVYYSIPVIVKISHDKHLFDLPNARKVNKQVVPNLGGIALFIGITLTTLLSISNNPFPEFRFILSGMIILFFIGIKDDILIISAHKKFTAQILSAMILIILGDIRFTNLHGILGFHEIGYAFSVIFSLLAVVAIINAQNLIDGIDGLAASVGILAAFLFGSAFFLTDQTNYAILCAATTGSLISFFIYNVYGKKNKIFMGDTGSLILGLLLSVFVIQYNEFSISGSELVFNFSPVFSLAILAIPVFDMIRIFSFRIYRRKSPFSPDMNHIHHKYLRLGLSHRKINLILITANLFIIGIVFTFRTINNNLLLLLLITMVGLLMLFPRFLHSTKTAKNKFDIHGHLLPTKKKLAQKQL